jgi:hypothetical protein
MTQIEFRHPLHIMFTRYWRHILFFAFVAGFLITAPIVVLYTAGYRYHAGTGKIVQTGVLSIRSIPKGAMIYIDDVLQNDRTTAVIGNVLPGSHRIRVEKPDYSSWEKTLDVFSKQSTLVSQLVLFLDQPPEFSKPTQSPKPPATKPAWETLQTKKFSVQNTPDRSIVSRMDENEVASIVAYLPLSAYQFEEAPSPYLMLLDKKRERVVLIDTQESTQPILLNTDATQWAWSSTGDSLLLSDGFDIEVYIPSIHAQETITRLSQPIVGLQWYPLGREVVFSYGGAIFAQELDRRGQSNKTMLVAGLIIRNFWFENDGEWLVGTTADGMFRKKLQR